MSISIITVTYNSASEIEEYIESVRQQNESIELWIVDNASSDNTVDIVNRLAKKYPWISLIANSENVGLAAANNMPLSKLKGEFTAIVNPDVVLHAGAMSALRTYIKENPGVVAVAPVNVYADGEPHTSFHRNWTLLHLLLWRTLPGRITHSIYRFIRRYNEQDVLFASGSCILMRSADNKEIGGYDPMYFLAVEDACDLCIRLRRGNPNARVVVTPKSVITHLISRSSAGVPFIVLWKSACGSIYHFDKHGGALAGYVAYAIQFSSSLIRLAGAWISSFINSTYRENFNNNLKVITGLMHNSPLKKKEGRIL